MNNYISANSVYNGILLGAKKISMCKEELNIANKFPVPDSDTGDNLHYQMSRLRNTLEYDPNINNMLLSASEIAVLNSRGNSGAIFSQFLVGFEKNTPNENKIHLNNFIGCFKTGYEYSLKSISNPITDGTILIAIKTWSEALERNVNKINSIDKLYNTCIKELKKVVDNTKYVLEEQKRGNYSDAGAIAFLYFIEGFMSAIVYDKKDELEKEEVIELINSDAHSQAEFELSDFRFCTEVLIKKNNEKFKRDELKGLGDSLVVSESERYLKVHVHTDKPYELTKIASNYGSILESKCDDMKIQSISGNIGGTALLIDSIADIPESLHTESTYMIPVNLLVDNVSFKDKRTVHPEIFRHSKVSSSQPNNEDLRFVISKLLKSYDNVLILTVSSKMSGLYHQYKKIAEEFGDNRIYLVDTKLNSVAEGLVVYDALKMIKNQKPISEIIANLERTIDNTNILVSLKNLNRMVASGRLNSKVGKLLKWVNFLPIITINNDGKGVFFNFSFSENRNKDLIAKYLLKNIDKIEHYSVVHCDCLDEATEYASKLESVLGYPPLYISDISSVIQNFSGSGSIAVGYTLKK